MVFKIDPKFIAIQVLKAMAGYLLGLIIVLCFRHFKDIWDIIIPSFCAGFLIFWIFMIPRKIIINDRNISFTKANSYERISIALSSISKIETDSKLYNTLTMTTTSGETYKLHPKDLQSLKKALNPRK